MGVTYLDTKKDLPCGQLHRLFKLAGWADGPEDSDMLEYFNSPFLHSTLVVSAWENDRLIGAVRVLSDTIIRSVVYDLVVDPEFRGRGIGKELVRRCMEHYPDSEWLVQTTRQISGYYEKIGFKMNHDAFLTIPSRWQ